MGWLYLHGECATDPRTPEEEAEEIQRRSRACSSQKRNNPPAWFQLVEHPCPSASHSGSSGGSVSLSDAWNQGRPLVHSQLYISPFCGIVESLGGSVAWDIIDG